MTSRSVGYKRHRFSPAIIAHAVWLYFSFSLSLRLVEDAAGARHGRLLRDGATVGDEVRARLRAPPEAQESEPPRYPAPRRGRRHHRRQTALVAAGGRSGAGDVSHK